MVTGGETSLRWYGTGFGEIVSLWTNRRALRSLARYDLRKMYAGTVGGLLWTFLTPLLPMLVFSAVFSFGLRLPLGGAPYIFGFAAAYVPWVLLSGSISSASGSIVAHRYLVKRIPFPVEIIPADAVLVHSLPHVLLLFVTGAACLIAGYVRFPHFLLLLYFYGCTVLLMIGAGLLVSSLAAVARDFQQMLPALLQVWFWLTPIAWIGTQLPRPVKTLLAFNPAGYIVSGYRYALMPKIFSAPTAFESTSFWIVCLSTLVIGSVCFRRLRGHFWDCL
jgi:lipopolysaccharide transport system permease protein/teichoic acid transport system permease protein